MGPVPGPGGGEHIELGYRAQVNADKAEIDAAQGQIADAGNGGLDGLGILGDVLGCDHLVIIGISGEEIGVQALDNFNDLVGNVQIFMEHIHNGLPDYGIQRDQQQHGHKAPQAAAAHGYALFLVQLLDGLVLAVGVVGIAALDVLHSGGQAGHLHHALLGLCGNGQQNQLHQNCEQDQSHTVAVGQPVQQLHQVAEGHLDDIGNVE